MNYYKNVLLWLFVGLVYQGVTAQNRTPFEEVVLLQDEVYLTDFEGFQPQVIKKSNATTKFLGRKPDFTLEYTPDSAYLGTDTLIIEYRDSEDWFRSKIQYLSLIMKVVQSTVTAHQDYYVVAPGDTLLADVLDNDETSAGSLTLESIPISDHGETSIANGIIQFIPENGFNGLTSFQYVACDSLGVCDFAYVTVLVTGGSIESDTVDIATPQDESLDVTLSSDTYTVLDSSKNGTLELISFVVTYTPDQDYFGLDSFTLEESSGATRLYRVDVIEDLDKRTILVDDVVYTAINHEVWIDVQKNDVTDNFKTKTLKQPGLGTLYYIDSVKQYKYVPPLDIESIEFFEYGLKGGKVDEKATGTIYINDGHPDASGTYHFETPMNTPLVMKYDLPFSQHEFRVKHPPLVGRLDVYNQDTTITIKCDTISGDHFLVMTPGRFFLGAHALTLEHCVTGTNICREIDVVVTSVDSIAGSCYCMDDCVWSGDINYDGRVDMRDLLPLAHHLGQSGTVRSGGNLDWEAQRAALWNKKVVGTKADLKHADADGNGMLEAADSIAIVDNYHKEHSLVPQLVGPSRQYAWYLVPRFDTVNAGELAIIDVQFGVPGYPIEAMEGVAYTVNFSPHVKYDSASLKVTNHPSSFLTSNSPYLDLAIQPKYRRLDVGVARTSGTDASGFGVISTLEFIVEEDLMGIKSNLGIVPVTLDLSGAVGIATNGDQFSLPDGQVTIYIDYGSNKRKFGADRLTVWPNPAQGVFNIHLNGDEEMQSATLYSMDGRMIQSWSNIDPDRQRMIVDRNLRGAFLLRVETSAGPITKKIQLLGH